MIDSLVLVLKGPRTATAITPTAITPTATTATATTPNRAVHI